MKTKFALPFLLRSLVLAAALITGRAGAETLKSDTVVFAQTDAKSAILARLKSGATVTVVGEAPAGWRRIELSGPFEAYVNNQDITKSLDVREGANIYAAPRKDAQVLTVAAAGDKTEITALVPGNNDFCQIRLEKKLQGFIAIGAAANTPSAQLAPLSRPTPAPTANTNPAPVTAPGRPVKLGHNSADMPRLFAGKLVLARRPILNPNPPYDYQLVDATGRRFAYVDTQRLLLTDKIETYLDRELSITGTVRNTVDGQDLVIAAEAMQLKK